MEQKKVINFILITILSVAVIIILLANFGVDVFSSPRMEEKYLESFAETEKGVILNAEVSDLSSTLIYSTNIAKDEIHTIGVYLNGEKQDLNLKFHEDFKQLDTGVYLDPKKLIDGNNDVYLKILLKNRKTFEDRRLLRFDLSGPEIISMDTADDASYQIIDVIDVAEISAVYYLDGIGTSIDSLIDLGSGRYKLVVGDMGLEDIVYYLADVNGNKNAYSPQSLVGGFDRIEKLVPSMNLPQEINPQLISFEDIIQVTKFGVTEEGETIDLSLSPASCEYRAKFVSFFLYDDYSLETGFARAHTNLNMIYGGYILSINRFNQQLVPTDYSPLSSQLIVPGDYYLVGLDKNNLGPFEGIVEEDYDVSYYTDENLVIHEIHIPNGGFRVTDNHYFFERIKAFNDGSLTTSVEGFVEAVTNPIDRELILIADSLSDAAGSTRPREGMMLLSNTNSVVVGHEMAHSLGLGHWNANGPGVSAVNLMDTNPYPSTRLEWNQLERIHAALCGDPANKISLEGRYGGFGVNLDYEGFLAGDGTNKCGNGMIAKNEQDDWEWCEDSFEEVPVWGSEVCPDMYSRPIVKWPSVYSCSSSCLCSGGGTGSEPPAPGTGDSVPPGGGGNPGGGPSTPPGGPQGKDCATCKPEPVFEQNPDSFLMEPTGEYECPDKDCPNGAGPNGEIVEMECKPDMSQLSPGQPPYSCKCQPATGKKPKEASDRSFEEF
jgi:hypothetical protein